MPKVSHRSTARKARRGKQSSSVYRVRNWAAYAQALKQRGQVTVWYFARGGTGLGLSGSRPAGGAICVFGSGD